MRRTPLAALLFCIGACTVAARTVFAQDPPIEEVTVTGTRIIRSGMVTPVPVTAVSSDELQNMSPGPLLQSLSQLPQFFANQTPDQVNGGQNSGGSNVNLRGAGPNRTLVLLDGRRVVPTNRFGSVDVAMFPEELLRSVETVTGGASASYGTDAVAGVVNFLLNTDYTGFKGHGQVGETHYGDAENYEVGFAFGTDLGERGHLIGSIEANKIDPVDTFASLRDRSFYRQRSRVTNPNYDPADPSSGPRLLLLPYAIPTNWNQTGMINQPGSSLDKLVFNSDGTHGTLPFSGVGQLNGGCNCEAQPTQTYGVDVDDDLASGYKRASAFLYYDHDLSDRLKFYTQVLGGDNEASDRRESISFILTWAPRLFADNAYLPTDVAATMMQPGQATIVPGSDGVPSVGFAEFGVDRPDTPLGDARQLTKNRMVSTTVGFKGDLQRNGFLDGWHLNGYYQHGRNDQAFDTDNGIRVDRIPLAFDAVRDPNGNIVCHVALVDPANFGDCVPMNIFGGVQSISPEAARYIVDDYKHALQQIRQDVAEFVMTGDLFDGFGAGPVSAAFGTSYRAERLEQSTPDPTDEYPATPSGVLLSDLGLLPAGIRGLIPQNLPNGIPGVRNVPVGFTGDANSSSVTFSSLRAISGDYHVKEAFGELNMPILSNLKIAKALDVSASARWADYSGSGAIWAGKLGFNWQVSDALRVRATESRDVRAASLRERFDQTRGGVNVTDPENNNAPISTASFSGGNPNVAPERADTATIGTVVQPRKVDGLSFSVDWYKIDIADAIAQLTSQTVVTNCFRGDLTLCQYVHRDPTTNAITRVDNLFINLQNQTLRGIDFELTYRIGSFNWRFFASELAENSIKNPGGPRDDRVGDMSAPYGLPQYKLTTNVTYDRGKLSLFAQERYIGGGVIDHTLVEGVDIDRNTVDATFYTDFGIHYRVGDEKWELFGNIQNLFDQDPQPTPGIIGRTGTNEFNSALYDVLGRRFVVGARRSF